MIAIFIIISWVIMGVLSFGMSMGSWWSFYHKQIEIYGESYYNNHVKITDDILLYTFSGPIGLFCSFWVLHDEPRKDIFKWSFKDLKPHSNYTSNPAQ